MKLSPQRNKYLILVGRFTIFHLVFMFITSMSAYGYQKVKRNDLSLENRAELPVQSAQQAIQNNGIQGNYMDFNAHHIENNAKLINLRFDASRDLIRLDDTKLIEDDAPATGLPEGYESYTSTSGPVAWVEDLKKGVIIKKILQVENPSAVSARVVFKGIEVKDNMEPLHLSLNGKEFLRPASRVAYPEARQYMDLEWDRWFYVELPVEELRKGGNELLMWTESDSTSWRILVAHADEFKRGSLTRTTHPNRSMKSNDGGKTWSDSELGAMNSIDGEYSIRLSLDQYLSSGEYTSHLIDVVDGDDPLKRFVLDLKVSLWPEVESPEKTNVHTLVRFGPTPYINNSWTDWMFIKEGKEYSLDDKRYLQWRAKLTTDDPLITPRIKGIRISAAWEDHSPNEKKGLNVDVINNGNIVFSSYPFTYEDLDHPGLKRYREIHKLDKIVEGASSEFEIMMRLLNWAYRVPITHEAYSWNWNNVTVQTSTEDEKSPQTSVEPESIKQMEMPWLNGPFFEGRRMVGMCLYPNQVLIGAFLSMGYQARHVNLHSEGMSGHEAMEVWSNEFNKWIYLDATRDYYYFNPASGVPLNLLEIHRLLVKEMPRVESWKHPFVPDIGEKVVSRIDVGMRQGNNPFSIEEGGGNYILKTMGHFRIIPRNDFLSNPLPVPVHTGNTSWGWSGFLNWYDETFPKRDEYQRYTNRESDFYQPLNQAMVFLNETDEPGILKVDLNNFTPGGFLTYLVRVNDGKWIVQKKSSWNWELQSGRNQIEVRVKNLKGVLGPVSNLQVTYNP